MAEETQIPKWTGKVQAAVKKATADQIWILFTDFFNIHKWFPNLPSSYGIHGTNGEPGCIRYCSGFSLPSSQLVSWSKERLTAVDHFRRFLSYEIVDCNVGFKGYESTVQIVPGEGEGCLIEWGFRVDPVEGWTVDDLVKRYETVLIAAARKMEDDVIGIGSI
ncbi:Lachrymatory-factor synthase [Linum perenne]